MVQIQFIVSNLIDLYVLPKQGHICADDNPSHLKINLLEDYFPDNSRNHGVNKYKT